jgi:hypothetical protein
MNTVNHSFEVVGLDDSYTVLHETSSSYLAVLWAKGYISKESAGNWPVIEVYDVRNHDEHERVWFWENPCVDGEQS